MAAAAGIIQTMIVDTVNEYGRSGKPHTLHVRGDVTNEHGKQNNKQTRAGQAYGHTVHTLH